MLGGVELQLCAFAAHVFCIIAAGRGHDWGASYPHQRALDHVIVIELELSAVRPTSKVTPTASTPGPKASTASNLIARASALSTLTRTPTSSHEHIHPHQQHCRPLHLPRALQLPTLLHKICLTALSSGLSLTPSPHSPMKAPSQHNSPAGAPSSSNTPSTTGNSHSP